MTPAEAIQKAKERRTDYLERRGEPAFQKTMAWFNYLGLLRHNRIKPARHRVTLAEALTAAELEPRVLEILPAVLATVPEVFAETPSDVPKDLADVVEGLKNGVHVPNFRGMKDADMAQWLDAPCMQMARKRANFRTAPRGRRTPRTGLAEIIKTGRKDLFMTQKEFADKYQVSIRVLRDLEQGKKSASFDAVEKILRALGKEIRF